MFSRDSALNALANELASKKDITSFIVSDNECGVLSFVDRAATHFAHNCVVDCNDVQVRDFIELLVDKIMGVDSANKRINSQILFSRGAKYANRILIGYILKRIGATSNENFLVTFLHTNKLDEKCVDIVGYMVKHAPSNLKFIIHSIDIPKFSPSKIGNKRPLYLDDSLISGEDMKAEFVDYFEKLPEELKALYVYLGNVTAVGETVLRNMSAKVSATFVDDVKSTAVGRFIYQGDENFYSTCTFVKRVLAEKEGEYRAKYPELFAMNPEYKVAAYLATNVDYAAGAFNIFRELGEMKKMEETCAFLAKYDVEKVGDLCMMYITNPDLYLSEAPDETFYYYNIVRVFHLIGNGKVEEANSIWLRSYEHFRSVNDVNGMTISLIAVIKFLNIVADTHIPTADEINMVNSGIAELKNQSPIYYNWVFGLSVKFRSFTDAPIEPYRDAIYDIVHKKSPFYIYDMGSLVTEYMKLGNFRQTFEIIKEIKLYLPHYLVPYNLITCQYYLGDIENATYFASEADANADKYDWQTDRAHLHILLAQIAFYNGRKDEGFSRIEKAIAMLDVDNNVEKSTFYRAICYKYIMMAKNGEVNLVKDLTSVYVKYCIAHDPEGVPYMQCALAFTYSILGDKERAYFHASEAIKGLKTKSVVWLICMGISTSYMLKNNDRTNADMLARNILRAGQVSGMNMVFVDLYEEIFGSIINFAQINGIELEYVAELEKLHGMKSNARSAGANFCVSMFGEVVITSSGKTVQWKTRKSRDLFLLYLMAGKTGLDRATIIDYLWNGYLYESAINNLKTTNNIIRNTLKDCGLKFDLEYINTKYILTIDEIDNDHKTLKNLLAEIKVEHTNDEYIQIVNKILDIYKGDFATDINYQEFVDERNTLKHEVRMALVGAVRKLEKNGDYLEAKRVLTSLIKIDKKFDYSHMQLIIDSKLGF